MYEVVHRDVQVSTRLGQPNVSIVAKAHDTRIYLLVLVLLKEPWQTVSKPVMLPCPISSLLGDL